MKRAVDPNALVRGPEKRVKVRAHPDVSAQNQSIEPIASLASVLDSGLASASSVPFREILAASSTRIVPEMIDKITRRYFNARIKGAVSQGLQKKIVDASGLIQAIQLFEHSQLDYCEEHRLMFYLLAKVLTNPLCQTIYNARLRVFSDYSESVEFIDSTFARNVIRQLLTVDEQDRVSAFFNALATIRPFPMSQKYFLEIDVAQHVLNALNASCESKINDINTPEDYEQIRRMLRVLKTVGGDKTIFDEIKHCAAAAIESEDWASTRTYAQLMDEIWNALAQPQTALEDFTEKLESSKGYRLIAVAAIRASSPVMSSAPRRDVEASEPSRDDNPIAKR